LMRTVWAAPEAGVQVYSTMSPVPGSPPPWPTVTVTLPVLVVLHRVTSAGVVDRAISRPPSPVAGLIVTWPRVVAVTCTVLVTSNAGTPVEPCVTVPPLSDRSSWVPPVTASLPRTWSWAAAAGAARRVSAGKRQVTSNEPVAVSGTARVTFRVVVLMGPPVQVYATTRVFSAFAAAGEGASSRARHRRGASTANFRTFRLPEEGHERDYTTMAAFGRVCGEFRILGRIISCLGVLGYGP